MNKLKKIGLTALSASLVAISANAGEMSVAGSAKIATEGFSGKNQDAGTTFSMGNQLTFKGSGELENGLNVSLSFVLDQGDDTSSGLANAPFDSHSVSVGNDTLGTLKFAGEGGDTASSQIDTTAAGDMWDNFDGKTYDDGGSSTVADLAIASDAGDNAILYTSPELTDGLTLVGSYQPQADKYEAGTGYGVNYTGVEGLSLSYANTDVVGTNSDTSGDNTVIKASYAYGPVTVAYSNMDHDLGLAAGTTDVEITSYAISYSVTDSISVTYGNEESKKGGATADGEIDGISASYTAGGMTISASMQDGENLNYGTSADQDMEYWGLSASFAF